jgi:hypothetical protein
MNLSRFEQTRIKIAAPLAVLAACILVSAGCVSKRGEMGVLNEWRNPSAPVFEKGVSTESQVMQALGPPSQVIALEDNSLFY